MNSEKGAINADEKSIRYDQTNNIIERFLADLKVQGKTDFWLESCNVCASACAVEAVGAAWKTEIPKINGIMPYGQDDLLFFLLYSTYGQANAPDTKSGVCENELIENLAWGITQLANVTATVAHPKTPAELVEQVAAALRRGNAVVLSYLTDYNSGHYVCLVKRNDDLKLCIGHDSWAANKHCRNGGYRELYTDGFLTQRARLRFIEVAHA